MRVHEESLKNSLSYWQEELTGAPIRLELPTDRPRPAVQSFRQASESFTLSVGLSDRLKSVGNGENASIFMTLCAGFLTILNRYTGQEDILIATRIPCRAQGETHAANTVVLRARFTDPSPFRSLLQQVGQRVQGASDHSDLRFEQFVEELVPQRDPSHAPLCQVMFILGTAAAVSDNHSANTQFDLILIIAETENGLEGSIAYSVDLFDAHTIRRLCGHYEAILEAIARDPDQTITKLPMLTERERTQILHEWNETRVAYPEICAHQLFEQQAAQHPDSVALVYEDRQLTYGELDQRANQVAQHLRKRGIGPEALVGVCLERSPELVIALFGVWKAGGAYVPLDPTYPSERLSYMLRDAAVKILVTDEKHRSLFASEANRAIFIDSDWSIIARESISNLQSASTLSNLAYVMYTSGSTGQPKGVMVLQRGLVNYLCWAREFYSVGSGESVPVHSSIAFDLTVTALFVPLVGGGRVEMLREDVGAQNLVAALRAVSERSLVKITPAHLALLSEQLGPDGAARRTKLFVIGGENLLAESLALWRDYAPATRLVNEYGPTETVVGCCIYEVAAGDPRSGAVPIGRPIANTQLYILDPYLNPLPVGISGELYIGGSGVARGYWNRPELTAERFLSDPFSSESGARLYKTGDLARYRIDGTLEYLGRMDNQVKVRGYRIELGEIEETLADHPGVMACAVLAREDTPGNKQLVGYVVARKENTPPAEDLQRFLSDKLPDYMVPSQLVFLDSMPLTSNGKVDRKGLPAPSPKSVSPAQSRFAPSSEIEKKLSVIWCELLNLESIGINDNFFELGAHSLLAIKAVRQIQDVFEAELDAQDVFDDPTIAGLSRILSQKTSRVGEVEIRRGPFFFGEPQLFGVYHPAQSGSVRETAVLVCPSIGHEHTRAYRAVQLLCEAAAREGFSTLRFDYTGVGDSAGEFASASVEIWCNDVVRALEALATRSGAREINVIGFRLGAALAAAALRRAGPHIATPVKSLLLWDPVLSGGEFLQLASKFQELFLTDSDRFSKRTLRARRLNGQSTSDDLLIGYSFPAAMRVSLERLDCHRVEDWPAVAIQAVLSEPSASWEDLEARFNLAGKPAASDLVKDAEATWADYRSHEKTLRAGPVVSRIVERLAGSNL